MKFAQLLVVAKISKMEYQDLNSMLSETGEKKKYKVFLTKRNLIIAAAVALSTLFTASIAFNVYSVATSDPQSPVSEKISYEEIRVPPQSKEIKFPIPTHNVTTIECQREFFLFHQDHNHVCEVTGVVIKNDTNVTINGNSKINVLYIFNYEVYKLPKLIFRKFINLKHLIVNGNHMRIFEEDTFEGAENLEVLRLSNNDLTELESFIFRAMRNLKTLDLGRNKISTIDADAFKGLKNLERLYLSDNFLKEIRTGTFYPLRKLVSLSLENNQISQLEDNVFMENSVVRSIGLSNNSFKELQNEIFRNFENLSDLSVSDLRITSLNLNGTKTIQTLVIRNTDIVNITLSNYPKILVSYGTNLEFIQFVIDETTADFTKIPNWGGMFYNKNIRFVFYFKKSIALQQNIESYDGVIRSHIYLPEGYTTSDKTEYVAVEYIARTD